MPFRYRMLLPLLALFAAIVGYPLINAVYLSLTNYTLTEQSGRFVGLAQYVDVVADGGFWNAVTNTAIFVVVAVSVELLLGLALALLLQRQRRARNLTRALVFTPMFVTPIAVGLMFRFLLNSQLGPIPALLDGFGLNVGFFTPGAALYTLATIDAWQWTPFMVLLLLAGLESLPSSPFEAARVDGASVWLTLRRVTLPLLRPVIAIAVLIRALDALRVFEYVYAITRGGPGTETVTLQYYIYQQGIQFFDLAQASAMGFLLLLMVLFLVAVLYRRTQREAAA